MNKVNILVTGATGFIGSNLVQKLSNSGHNLLCLSRKKEKFFFKKNIQWLKSDLSSPSSYTDEVEDFRPNVVIHLSWQDIPDFSLSKSKLNLNQSIDFLSFVINLGSCQKILVSGSCFEYTNPKGICREADNNFPNSYFSWAKLSLYSWLSINCNEKEIDFAWIRMFYVYGPGQRLNSLIPTILSSLKNKSLPNINNYSNANDYVFIDDVIDAFDLCIENKFSSGIFNIGSGHSIPVLEIFKYAELIILESDDFSREIDCNKHLSNLNIDFWADISKAKKEINWAPKIEIEAGLTKTWIEFKNK
jgi:UDP-glucose 4-epimerase